MTTIRKSALVPYSADAMFALVADVEAYPEFLPWCGGARLLSKDEDTMTASIEIAYGGIRKTFTTRNRFQPGKMMELRLVEGPFKHLHGYWLFQALDEHACKVSFDIEFEFSNRLVKMALGPIFETIASELVDQFHRRARALYGEGRG